MDLSELRTNSDVTDYLRQLIFALETGEKTSKEVKAGVVAAKALAVELNRPSGRWGSTLSAGAEQTKPSSRAKGRG